MKKGSRNILSDEVRCTAVFVENVVKKSVKVHRTAVY
jgi:hypothetical protein